MRRDHHAVADQRPLRCPRCGYDQRGVAALWADAWPLSGTCSECGLDFEWADVFVPTRKRPRWCIEYVPWRRAGPTIAYARTLLHLFRPFRFWTALRMTHEPRWGRLSVFVLLLVMTGYILFAAGIGHWVYRATNPGGQPAPGFVNPTATERLVSVVHGAALPWSMESVAATKALGQRSQLRPIQLTSAFGRGLGMEFHAMYSGGTISLANGETRRQFAMGVVLAVPLICPLGFLALPISRRQAKVRWTHIGRIWIYTLPAYLVPFSWLLVRNLGWRWGAPAWIEPWLFWASVLVPLWLLVWWWAATSRDLRMPHGVGVGVWVVTISLLLAVFGQVLLGLAA